MNYGIYIEEYSIVRVLSIVIDDIYFKEDYTIVSKWNNGIPYDIMIYALIFGYTNDSFLCHKIEQLCKRDKVVHINHINNIDNININHTVLGNKITLSAEDYEGVIDLAKKEIAAKHTA